AKPHSIPAPTSQPLLVLLSKMVTEAPVVALVMVTLLLPTQPPPALPKKSQLSYATPNRPARVVIQPLLELTWIGPMPRTAIPLFVLSLFPTQSMSHSTPRTMLLIW